LCNILKTWTSSVNMKLERGWAYFSFSPFEVAVFMFFRFFSFVEVYFKRF
jgi:hypothetical protein